MKSGTRPALGRGRYMLPTMNVTRDLRFQGVSYKPSNGPLRGGLSIYEAEQAREVLKSTDSRGNFIYGEVEGRIVGVHYTAQGDIRLGEDAKRNFRVIPFRLFQTKGRPEKLRVNTKQVLF